MTNAANARCSTINRKERAVVGALEAMFADRVSKTDQISSESIMRRNLDLHDCMTTDPQAEVLVIGQIPVISIKCVAFKNTFEQSEVERQLPRHLNTQVNFKVDQQLFTPRHDWEHWTNKQMQSSEHAGPDLDGDIPF